MFANFDYGEIYRSLGYLFGVGMAFTLRLTVFACAGGIALGTALAVIRLSHWRILAAVVGAYVNLMRSIPLILTIFWFYFLVPSLLGWALRSDQPVQINVFWTSVIAFVVFEAAYYCEIVRAGIRSIANGQRLASLALGMTPGQMMAYVILPQAVRTMVPVLITQTIMLFQDVSLVYVLSMTDFVGAASKIAERDARLPEMYLFVALTYFLICFGFSQLAARLRDRMTAYRQPAS